MPNDPKTTVNVRSATAHGWLRRADRDTRTGDAWEQPDGTLVLVEKGRKPTVLMLTPPDMAAERQLNEAYRAACPPTGADHEYRAWWQAKRRDQDKEPDNGL
jgi:hypothetical protein